MVARLLLSLKNRLSLVLGMDAPRPFGFGQPSHRRLLLTLATIWGLSGSSAEAGQTTFHDAQALPEGEAPLGLMGPDWAPPPDVSSDEEASQGLMGPDWAPPPGVTPVDTTAL